MKWRWKNQRWKYVDNWLNGNKNQRWKINVELTLKIQRWFNVVKSTLKRRWYYSRMETKVNVVIYQHLIFCLRVKYSQEFASLISATFQTVSIGNRKVSEFRSGFRSEFSTRLMVKRLLEQEKSNNMNSLKSYCIK